MLKNLDIENIAVIEKASVDFSSGLNVLTGETGAGKSIVVDSINAILGERTSKELVRYGCDNAFVSAYFDDIDDSVISAVCDMGFEFDDNSILLSRRISASGKSTCKINGKSATVSMLKEIGALLVNIHGQHDSQALLNPECQYKYIDMLIKDNSVVDEYHLSFKKLIAIRRRLKELTNSETDKDRELELLDYQIDELTAADIKVGEWDELNKKKALISRSEAITKTLSLILANLNGDDDNTGIQSILNDFFNSLLSIDEAREISDIFAQINDKIELGKDKIQILLDSLNFDPQELDMIEERLDLLYNFSRKYGSTEQEMLDFLEKAIEKKNTIIYSDEELEKLNMQYDKVLDETITLAQKLSDCRKSIAKKFEIQVKSELEFLDMPNLQFVVDFKKGNLSSIGFDKIEFLISTNAGEPPKSLSKIASGGELSRIMLAFKNILSYNDTIGTLIFDEIDTGVSGSASQKIGLKLKSVSKNTQVICVTHSAQLASNADEHFLIEKQTKNERTYTNVTPLDFEGRKYELARIMGGLVITESLLNSAEELLKN